jgi:hypothetical protein
MSSPPPQAATINMPVISANPFAARTARRSSCLMTPPEQLNQ